MSVEEALELGKRAIYHATHRDAFSGGSINCKYKNVFKSLRYNVYKCIMLIKMVGLITEILMFLNFIMIFKKNPKSLWFNKNFINFMINFYPISSIESSSKYFEFRSYQWF